MDRVEAAFAAMQETTLRQNVGDRDADQAKAGRLNFVTIVNTVSLPRDAAVLDFGCGIGRTSAPLADYLSAGRVVGTDIIPEQIQFCRDELSTRFPNASFYCTATAGSNPHYDHLIGQADAVPEADFFSRHEGEFDIVVAFSVFSHFNPDMSAHYLSALRPMLKPHGRMVLTWFLDHPRNPPWLIGRLPKGHEFLGPDNLWFALYAPALVERVAGDAGLAVEQVTFGSWRGWPLELKSQHYQDVVVLRH